MQKINIIFFMMQNDMFELMAEVGKVLNIDEDIGKYNKLADRYEYDYELWEDLLKKNLYKHMLPRKQYQH